MKRYTKAGQIKVGVVGYGGAFNMGKCHLMEMQKAGMVPAAVTEIDPARLKVAETDFPGIGTFASVGAMLKGSDVDLVTIITSHNTHAKLAIECLKAGRHVVTEKPFAITTAECDAMIAAAKKSRVTLSTYHNRHWEGQLEITGAKGTFVFSHRDWTAITHDGKNTVITKGASPDNEGWKFYQNVADHLTKGTKLVITPEWARRPIHLIDLACRSAKSGRSLPTVYK
ncbi:MAG: Gfo/Idh/MocA family oxidoreductase [Planctomycetota bacterium]